MEEILVVGELCTDKFVYGEVKRLSPEAPVPILNPSQVIINSGMAGNVVENLKILTPYSEIHLLHQKKEITKTRYVEKKSNHMFLRTDEGDDNVDALILDDFYVLGLIEDVDAVIISDYNKGFLSEETILDLAQKSKFSVLDSKKKLSNETLQYIDFVKLNEFEYLENKDIVDRFPEKFIITLGSKGAKHKDKIFSSPNPQQTIDVSGAGDTFVAAFTIYYLRTNDVEKSIMFANECCADVVSRKGVSLPAKRFEKILDGL